DPSSINKNVPVDVPIVGDVGSVLADMIKKWKALKPKQDQAALKKWWGQIDQWRAKKCLAFQQKGDTIKPQHAIRRLFELTQGRETFITTEVGQ
ncbi:MAG TPA: acetolactate synthase 3 large subunit, partial [Rhodospirillaceae bacterium]|nr:acetolactate synthase 3 large subunit [Rhodospirillaceae bacterium]